jgi:hypothetical protein
MGMSGVKVAKGVAFGVLVSASLLALAVGSTTKSTTGSGVTRVTIISLFDAKLAKPKKTPKTENTIVTNTKKGSLFVKNSVILITSNLFC